MATDPGKVARNKLIELERRRQLAVVTQFKRIETWLAAEISDLLDRIDKERRIDGNASPGLLFEKTRLSRVLNALTDDIRATDARLAAIAAGSQTDAIEVARQQAESIPQISSDLGFFDSAATRELIGIAGDGQPLANLFADLAIPARTAVFDALFYGVAAGIPNPMIVRQIRDAIGGTTARAMTITRTETNRAYREATRKFYEQAPGVIGWRWLAVLDLRTCPICWALHGRIFKTKTKFGTHPNCRCTMVAVFAGDSKVPTGPEIFDGLTDAQKKTILGPRRLDLYYQGANLSDFVETNRSAFGIGRNIKPLIRTTFKPNPRPGPDSTPRPAVVTPTPALIDRATPKPALPAATAPGIPTAKDAKAARIAFLKDHERRGGPELTKTAERLAAEQTRLALEQRAAWKRISDWAQINPNTPFRGTPIHDEYLKVTKELNDAAEAAQKFRNEKLSRLAELDRAALAVDRPLQLDIKFDKRHRWNDAKRAVVRDAVNSFRNLVDDRTWNGARQTVNVRIETQREFQGGDSIFINPIPSRRHVIAHELGHFIDEYNRDVLDQALDFRDYRAAGEKAQPMKDLFPERRYKADEIMFKDKFRTAYSGKIYRDRQGNDTASEILSTGIEAFYKEPAEFAREDPEFFEFIWLIIRGGKWKRPK